MWIRILKIRQIFFIKKEFVVESVHGYYGQIAYLIKTTSI